MIPPEDLEIPSPHGQSKVVAVRSVDQADYCDGAVVQEKR
jgi:hypothetical protein